MACLKDYELITQSHGNSSVHADAGGTTRSDHQNCEYRHRSVFFMVSGARHTADLSGFSQYQEHLCLGFAEGCPKSKKKTKKTNPVSVSGVEENCLVDFKGHGSEVKIWQTGGAVFACTARQKLSDKDEVISFLSVHVRQRK